MSLVIRERLEAISENIWHFTVYVSHFNLVKSTKSQITLFNCRRVFDSAIVNISIKWSKTFRLWNLMNWVFPDSTYLLSEKYTYWFPIWFSAIFVLYFGSPTYLFDFLFFKKCNLSNLSTLFSNNLNDNSFELFALLEKKEKMFHVCTFKMPILFKKTNQLSNYFKN